MNRILCFKRLQLMKLKRENLKGELETTQRGGGLQASTEKRNLNEWNFSMFNQV